MDLKVYKKEEVLQPEGKEEVYVPDVIDLIPEIVTDDNGNKTLTGAIVYKDTENDKELLEQECALATIWQKGLDPLDKEDGVRWSQVLLEEINPLQLMEDIISAVAKVTLKVAVVFDTITDKDGNSFLTYNLRAIA